jgi:hypothetical protein
MGCTSSSAKAPTIALEIESKFLSNRLRFRDQELQQ